MTKDLSTVNTSATSALEKIIPTLKRVRNQTQLLSLVDNALQPLIGKGVSQKYYDDITNRIKSKKDLTQSIYVVINASLKGAKLGVIN